MVKGDVRGGGASREPHAGDNVVHFPLKGLLGKISEGGKLGTGELGSERLEEERRRSEEEGAEEGRELRRDGRNSRDTRPMLHHSSNSAPDFRPGFGLVK